MLFLSAQRRGHGSVNGIHPDGFHPSRLKHTLRRTESQQRQVGSGRIANELQPVETTAHMGKTEMADQAVAKPVAFQGGERRVLGCRFKTVDKFEPSQAQAVRCAAQPFQAQKSLLEKNAGVVAVESIEGTDETIRRAGRLAGSGTVVVKVARPGQDFRFDVPAVGLETVRVCAEAGARALAFEHGRTLVLEPEALIRAADEARLCVVSESV